MKKILYTLIFVTTLIASCNKVDEDDTGSITCETKGLFIDVASDELVVSTTFEYENLESITVSSYPSGWSLTASLSTKTITATAPTDLDDEDYDAYGSAYIYGETPGGNIVSVYLLLGKVEFVALDDMDGVDTQANSMIVSKPNTVYTFNPNRRGEAPEDASLSKITDAEVIWRTSGTPIQYVQMFGDRIGFYTQDDDDDDDGDGDETDIVEGNAIISGMDINGVRQWSWHIWVTDAEIGTAGDTNFMDRNLGAFGNSNVDDDILDYDENILNSHGLFYQWGRKDPFPTARTYNASGGDSAYIYNDSGSATSIDFDESSAATGYLIYTNYKPDHFLTANSNSSYDWLYGSNRSDDLWGTGSTKSIYDPSPKGWRVPASSDFDQFDTVDAVSTYGATINGNLLLAYGLRTYFDGKIQNLSGDGSYGAWSGYYWSRDPDGTSAKAFHFWSSGDTAEINNDAVLYRSYGMQIRCIKDI